MRHLSLLHVSIVNSNLTKTSSIVFTLLLSSFVADTTLYSQDVITKPKSNAVSASVSPTIEEKARIGEIEDTKPIKDDAIAREKWFRERYGPVTVEYLDYSLKLAEQEIQKWGAMIPGTVAYKASKNGASATWGGDIVKAGLPEKTWKNIGPLDGSSLQSGARDPNVVDTGRPTVILPHPTNANLLYVGFSGGGLWRCRNANLSAGFDWVWESVTDGLPNSGNLAVGGAAFKPEDPNTIYLGLGDWFDAQGRGFFISNDGGETWRRGGSVGNTTRTWKILALPGNIVMVAGNDGLYRSTNGGTSFSPVQNPPFSTSWTDRVWDIVRLDSGNLVLSAMLEGDDSRVGGVAYSTNNGATWTRATMAGFPADTIFGRIAIAASEDTLYGLYQTRGNRLFPRALMKSTDGGKNWFYQEATGLFSPTRSSTSFVDDDGGQAGYNQLIAVDPDDPGVVFTGANFSVYRSTDGGINFSQFTSWLGREFQYTHADMHAGVWSPPGRSEPRALYIATDGGLSIIRQPNISPIPNGSTSLFASNPAIIDHRRNRGIPTHLVYNIGSTNADTPPGSKNRIIIGTQDNGTLLRKDIQREFYDYVIGGDGFGCLIHPYNGDAVLGSLYYTRIYRSNDGGNSFRGVRGIPDDEDGPFHTRLVSTIADPTGNRVYTYTRITPYISDDFGENWTPMTIAGWPNPTRSIRGFGASPLKMGFVGAVGMTSPDGSGPRDDFYDFIAISDDNGETWRTSRIFDSSLSPVYGQLAELAFDTANPDIIYVCSVAYDANANHLWKSTDGGRTWVSIDGTRTSSNGFPFGIPVHVVKVDPLDNNMVYAGTDMGLYRTTNGGTSWSRFGYGLPLVAVRDIYIAPDGSFIRVGTYGRGVWEMEGITDNYAPIFSVHPQNQVSNTGLPVTFGAVAVGIPTPTYQWQVSTNNGSSWSNISNATGRLYTASFSASDDGKLFRAIATNARGNAISQNAAISLGVQVSVLPDNVALAPGEMYAFTARVTGTPENDVTWSVVGGSANGTITSTGIYTAPSRSGTYTISATSVEDVTRSGTAKVVVSSGIVVDIAPSVWTMATGGTYIFTAQVTGTSGSKNVTWSVVGGSANGIITSEGVYTAPATPGTYTITATSVEDSAKSGTATITVIFAGVFINDPQRGLLTGETATFRASVVGLGNDAVTWTATGGGKIDSGTGIYTAPDVAANVTITATSVEDPSISASVSVKITSPDFDGNAITNPQLLDFANAFGSTNPDDLLKYDLNNDGRIDDEDLSLLFRAMGWINAEL